MNFTIKRIVIEYCLSDIRKLFCCRFNASEVKSKFNFLPNWLADEFVPSNSYVPYSWN